MESKFLIKILLATALLLLVSFKVNAQDLMDLLEEETDEGKNYATAIFKGTRVVLGHSVKTRKTKELELFVMHRFGSMDNGMSDAFGLDDANIRIAFEYGITDNLNIGIGRSSILKTYDGFIKYRFLRQSHPGSPVTMVVLAGLARNTNEVASDMDLDFRHRMAYTYQFLIARKFTEGFSLQLTPSVTHKNLVTFREDDNTQFAIGLGGRLKLSPSVTFNAEYFYQINPNKFQVNSLNNSYYPDAVSIGVDIETGGHVFQLHFTNATAMIDKAIIHETTGDVRDGKIRFGFNLSRTFQIVSKQGWSGN